MSGISSLSLSPSRSDRHGPHSEESFDLMHPAMLPNIMSESPMDPINFSMMDNPAGYSYN